MLEVNVCTESYIYQHIFLWIFLRNSERSMDELKLGRHSERHSSHNVIREQGASEFFTFTEIKPGLAVIKLEPKGETELEPEPDGTLDPGPDGEIDPLALNTERAHPVVEQEDLPCPLAFLALESKAEDGMWDSAAATVKVEIDGETREVHLEECNGVGYDAWSECMKVDPQRWTHETEQRTSVKRKRRRCGRPRVYKTEEEMERQKERNKLRQRRYRASKTAEELQRERERDRLRKKQYRASQTEEELQRQRERDKLRKRKYRASQSTEELARQRMHDMLCKRRYRASKRLEIENFIQYYVHM